MASCDVTFTVVVANDLTVDCPDDPMLPACGSAADILAAYNTWVAGFGYMGGCDVTDNIANIPPWATSLAADRSAFTYTATSGPDGCQDMASCDATFTVAAATDLTVTARMTPMLPACSSAADILAAYNTWVAGFGYMGGCDVSDNIANVPPWATSPAEDSSAFTYTATSGTTVARIWLPATLPLPWRIADDLTVDCPDDPMLPACSSAADILAAYNTWVAGFGYMGGCDVS